MELEYMVNRILCIRHHQWNRKLKRNHDENRHYSVRLAEKQTDRQTDRQTDKWTDNYLDGYLRKLNEEFCKIETICKKTGKSHLRKFALPNSHSRELSASNMGYPCLNSEFMSRVS